MIDLFFCTNPVNYAVAMQGVGAGRQRPAFVFHETWRFEPQARSRVFHRRIGIWSYRLATVLARLGLVHTLYLPHHRFNRRVLACMDLVPRVAYLDDGLDTHRSVPRNFDLERLKGRPSYYTFDEFRELPDWMSRFEVHRVLGLQCLCGEAPGRGALPLDDITHLFVESPGLEPARWIAELSLPPGSVLVVRHPVPAKRSAVPAGCRVVEGQQVNLEAGLSSSRGLQVFFGETLALVYAAHTACATRHRILAQLPPPSRTRIGGLAWKPAGPWGDELLELAAT